MTYSTYVDGNRKADVIKLDNHWGCRLYENGELISTEFYKGHSEAYAEDAAENYVLGIKNAL
tara:strand:+ start:3647 stop:3832 length:186 start_codon:yes stop_codon:yes gene_type:complete